MSKFMAIIRDGIDRRAIFFEAEDVKSAWYHAYSEASYKYTYHEDIGVDKMYQMINDSWTLVE
jgi:hypothetical protein